MRYTFFIAKRYFFSKKEIGFITVISLISVIGVTVGVAALVVVMSVFNGFNGLVSSLLVSFDPHIRIHTTQQTTEQDITNLQQYLSQNFSIVGKSSFVAGKIMLISKNQSKVVFLRGLEPEKIQNVSGIKEKIILGELALQDSLRRNLVMGLSLADKLGTVVNDSIWVISPAGSQQALLGIGVPVLRSFHIVGIYESDNREYDGMYAFMSLTSAQKLLQIGNTIHGYELRLYSIDDAEKFKQEFLKKFSTQFEISTWYDLHKDLYSVMEIERWLGFIILSLIIAVALFNLLGSLTMSVIEKTRDIGILKTMGATNKDIIVIFQIEGILVGILGTIIGTILGLLICFLQQQFQLFPLDPTVYIIPAIPVEIHWQDILYTAIVTIVMSYAATIYPSKRAAKLLPAEAIRWE